MDMILFGPGVMEVSRTNEKNAAKFMMNRFPFLPLNLRAVAGLALIYLLARCILQ